MTIEFKSFSSFPTNSSCVSSAPSQISGLLFFNCYVHTPPKCINTSNSTPLMVFAYVFLGLDNQYQIEDSPLGKIGSPSLLVINCLQFVICAWSLVKFLRFMLVCQLVLSLFWSCLGNNIAEISRVRLSCHVQKTRSLSSYPGPLSPRPFPAPHL